ncbi:MAG: cyclic pyranopterin monophosphate synthase MoaC [Candidatus Kapabacteria bacterium]|nr:cyclic pyranopterin monophosphate synthase MoaC [Candidatus Kapabacteria bacterium]
MNLSHTDIDGKARMVDISSKSDTERTATAKCRVLMNKSAYQAVKDNNVAKGDVLSVVKIGAIQAAKRTSEIIPLCHNIFITFLDVTFQMLDEDNAIEITSIAKTNSSTGIEMEAITCVAAAGIIIYDMCKSIDKNIRITNIHLTGKTGGKSGDYHNE